MEVKDAGTGGRREKEKKGENKAALYRSKKMKNERGGKVHQLCTIKYGGPGKNI